MKQDITLAELKKTIKRLKKKQPPGPDSISNEMIQHLDNPEAAGHVQPWLERSPVPQCWTEASMIPVLKKGKNTTKVLSYRPISLTSCVCKTMERIVNQRLQWYLDSESIIAPEQAGFRRYKITEDQTIHLAQVIEDAFQAPKVTSAAFIDLQRAFDTTWCGRKVSL